MKIIGVHLYNDYSGSPRVLSQLLEHWATQHHQVHLLTSQHQGRLSNISKVQYHLFHYQWSKNQIKTLIQFLKVNLLIFFRVLRLAHAGDLVYINTLLPFGASWAAKIKKASCIYHIHETSVRPIWFKKFLKASARINASQIIYVSKYLKDTEGFGLSHEHVVYNALSDDFFEKAAQIKNTKPVEQKNILMLASLRAYKGIEEFVTLARRLPQFNFELVLNATNAERASFMSQMLPKNMILSPPSKDVHPFYERAALLLNLSRPDEWVETFGLTLIEAMAYGLPVIAPPVGGPSEIVIKAVGFQISCYDMENLVEHVNLLMTNHQLYQQLSQAAVSEATKYHKQHFLEKIDHLLTLTSSPNT
jgi:glycosyltransferase involved in cell wall biosynthesis